MADDTSSSARSETVKSYVTPATKRELDAEADRRGTSRSDVIAEYCRRGLRQDREDDLSTETEAARRLGDVIDAGLDDMEDVARAIQDQNTKSGVYAIATFELIKREYGQAAIRDALRTGARRIRADELPDPDEIAADEETTDSTDQTGRYVPSIDELEGDRG